MNANILIFAFQPENPAIDRRIHPPHKQVDIFRCAAGAGKETGNGLQILHLAPRLLQRFATRRLLRRLPTVNHAQNNLNHPRILPRQSGCRTKLFNQNNLIMLRIKQKHPRNSGTAMKNLTHENSTLRTIKPLMLNMQAIHTEIALKQDFTKQNFVFFVRHKKTHGNKGT